MKKIILVLFAMIISFSASAQLKVHSITHEADTLLYATQKGVLDGEVIELYKSPKGYLIKVASTNMFDVIPRFYLGKTKESAIQTLKDFIKLCDNDIATTAILEDAEGVLFLARTTFGTMYYKRTPTYTKSDRLYLTNDDMAGNMVIKDKVVEETIKFLNK